MSGAQQRPCGRTTIYSAMLIATAALLPQPAAAVGLFEALFGRGPVYVAPAPKYPMPMFREDRPRPSFKVMKPRSKITIEQVARPVKPRLTPVKLTAAEETSPVAKFLGDQTLRHGDVVVTSKGAYVFQGNGGSRHRVADFVPAQNARSLDKNMRTKVSEIARANRWMANIESRFENTPVASARQTVNAGMAKPGKPAQSVVAQDMSR